MELKFNETLFMMTLSNVLIVPLWNWNIASSPFENSKVCSNCTFMELKFGEELQHTKVSEF